MGRFQALTPLAAASSVITVGFIFLLASADEMSSVFFSFAIYVTPNPFRSGLAGRCRPVAPDKGLCLAVMWLKT